MCFGGGVRGGEEPTMELIFWKLCKGKSGSISSDGLLYTGDESSGIVASDIKEVLGRRFVRGRFIPGEDSGSR